MAVQKPTAPVRALRFRNGDAPDAASAGDRLAAIQQAVPQAELVLWQRAATLDELGLASLADATSANELAQRAASGGLVGYVALRALPWASDAQSELGRVCALLPRVVLSERMEVLRVVHQVVSSPPSLGEVLDVPGRELCVEQLRAVLQEPAAPAPDRDWVASALSYLRAEE